jgi:hypothetical protein
MLGAPSKHWHCFANSVVHSSRTHLHLKTLKLPRLSWKFHNFETSKTTWKFQNCHHRHFEKFHVHNYYIIMILKIIIII